MSLYGKLQELAGTRYTESNYARDVIDSDMLRLARENDVALPSVMETKRDKLHGAQVLDSSPGIHAGVVYMDLASLYPNLMRALNASPETLVGMEDDLLSSVYSPSDCVHGWVDPRPVKRVGPSETYSDFTDGEYKMVYDPNANTIKWRDSWESIQRELVKCYYLDPEQFDGPFGEGILPSRADDYIRWNKQYEGTLYKATKRQRNALYGVSGDTNFRLFDWRVAESITIAGRIVIDESIEYASDALNADPVIGDTDGFGIATALDQQTAVNKAMEVADELDSVYDDVMPEHFDIDEHYMDIEVESYASTLFVPQDEDGDGIKKTYAKHEMWNDDDFTDADKISITGFEAIRSDVADITVEAQSFVLETILENGRQSAQEIIFQYIRDLKERFDNEDIPLAEIGKRSGMSKSCFEYGTVNRRAHPTYRGAKYAHKHIPDEDFTSGGKPFKFAIDRVGRVESIPDNSTSCSPSPDGSHCEEHPSVYDVDTRESGTKVDYISVEDPSNLPDCATVDYDVQFEKTVAQPMQAIFRGMDWSWKDAITRTEQTTLG